MRLIDADASIEKLEKTICEPCKGDGDDYHGVKCRACWVDDTIGIIQDAPNINTKQVKYYDDDDNVWNLGSVIVNDSEKPNNSTDCSWR